MNAAAAKKPNPKTVADQRAAAAEKHPRIELVPDESRPHHPKASDTTCGARTNLAGRLVECELAPLHAGHHSGSGRSWRPNTAAELEAEIHAARAERRNSDG